MEKLECKGSLFHFLIADLRLERLILVKYVSFSLRCPSFGQPAEGFLSKDGVGLSFCYISWFILILILKVHSRD